MFSNLWDNLHEGRGFGYFLVLSSSSFQYLWHNLIKYNLKKYEFCV